MKMMNLKVTDKNTVLKLKNGNYEVEQNGFAWIGQGRRPYLMLRKKLFGKYRWFPKPLNFAHQKMHKVTENGIESTYGKFRFFFKKLPFTLTVLAEIKGDGKVDFTAKTINETGMDIEALYFPRPFNAKKYNKTKSYSVDTMRQGFILPDTWQTNRKSIGLLTAYWRKINSGDAYLPFWGRVCDGKGYVGIIDDANDANISSCYGKRKSFLSTVVWRSSLGKLSYSRTVHYHFYDKADYNTFAKQFRQQEIEQGNLYTLSEKIKDNPNVAKLKGSCIIHTCIYTKIQPASKFYKKGGKNGALHATFEKRAEEFAHYKALGLDKAYVHLDGWGEHGYDNNHPYILPPCPQAGGFEGMAKLADACQQIGYVFGLHDQYRDYYYSCKYYDKNEAVVDINGENPYCDIWYGGAHSWLCASYAMGYLKKMYSELEENNVKIEGVYLDVFGIMPGDECFHKDHPLTRKQSIEHRKECFRYMRAKGMIASSEESGCLVVNELDLVHHSPYAVRPQERGVGVGIAVPLANLVYHDCVVVPWSIEGIGGWGIPDGDSDKLHCILNAGIPYFNPGKDDLETAQKIKELKKVSEVQAKLFDQELINHEFLDSSFRRQRTTYANGVTIEVDFENQTYKVSNP